VAHLSGTYDSHGTTTSVNLKLDGQGMSVDDLEAVLPAVGVILPPKSQLKGGTLAVNLFDRRPGGQAGRNGNDPNAELGAVRL